MKIAILGYDVEGQASYQYFAAQGQELTILDQNPDLLLPAGVPGVLGEHYLDNLDRFDLLVRTPGLPPEQILAKNPGVADKITTLTNEFLRACPTRNIIGVTGTKGKGTTSTLITRMLEATGKSVHLGGNIGLPPLNFLAELTPESCVVLELSSFQLVDLQVSPHIAVCLMVVPEHLNWHAHLDDYHQAKAQLFAHQGTKDIAIYFADNAVSQQVAAHGNGQKIPYYASPGATVSDDSISIGGQTICRTDELKLLGRHNWQNVCAAVTAVWQITQDINAMRSVVTTFGGLEHRLQLVREIDSVQYYDDSFGTAPETAMVAIQAFSEPKVLILGGSNKGASYDELAQTVATDNVRSVLLIGDQADRIQTALEAADFTAFQAGGNTMTEIVAQARATAEPGDIVLLSTGCASFGMFKNYKDRGQQFTAAVQALA
jgi:UDP-N-acetylmuramoylalanine--D-glutamate ligase